MQIFSRVDARINPHVFGSVSSLKQVLDSLVLEFEIECYENRYGFAIFGSLEQITLCRKFILDEISKGKASQQMLPGSADDDIAVETASDDERGATSRSVGTSDDEKIDDAAYQAVPIIVRFIFTVPKYAMRIHDIESEFNVKIDGVEGGVKVIISPLPGCTRRKHDDACEKYIDFYKEVNDGPMMSKNILLEPVVGSDVSVKGAVKKVLRLEPVVIQKMEEQDKWMFYGEETNVRSAIAEVCKLLKMDNPLVKTRKVKVKYVADEKKNDHAVTAHSHSMPFGNDAAEEDALLENPNNTRSPILKDFLGDKDEPFAIETKKGFRLTVYQGDITLEQVNVIVNTTDDSLGFFAGLSGALANRGGDIIKKEALDKSSSMRRKIKPGHIILTGPGKLRCLKILHLISYSQSRRTKDKCKMIAKTGCLDCLKLAQKQKLTSIAFPALETGPQGITLDLCATVMINAVEEYMRENDPKAGAVADIRFVHLDPRAVEVFKAELTKRYGDSIVKPPGRKGYAGDSDSAETLSLPSPDKKVVSTVGKSVYST